MYAGTFAGQWSKTQHFTVQSGAELREGVREEPADQWHGSVWFKISTANDRKTLQFHPSLTNRQKPTLNFVVKFLVWIQDFYISIDKTEDQLCLMLSVWLIKPANLYL